MVWAFPFLLSVLQFDCGALRAYSQMKIKTNEFLSQFHRRRDRLVVRTLRCGRSNPGSNPGHGTLFPFLFFIFFS